MSERLPRLAREFLEFLWNHLPAVPIEEIPVHLRGASCWCMHRDRRWARIFGIANKPYVELLAAGRSRLDEDQLWDGKAEEVGSARASDAKNNSDLDRKFMEKAVEEARKSKTEDESDFTPEDKAEAFERLADSLETYLSREYSEKSDDPFPPIGPDSPEEVGREVQGDVEYVQDVCFGGKPLPVPIRTEWIELQTWSRKSEKGWSDPDCHDRRRRIRAHGHALQHWASTEADRDRREAIADDAESGPMGFPLPPVRHSPDFRSVHWYGADHSFTANQAACVKILWEAWDDKTPDVSGAYIVEKLEIQNASGRLDQVFRNPDGKGYHAAWRTMIVPGNTKGTYRLKEPEAE